MPDIPSRRRLRFSLRTLLLAAMLAGSGMLLWAHWEPWYTSRAIHVQAQASSVFQAHLSSDGSLLSVYTTPHSQLWNIDEGKLLDECAESENGFEISPNSKWVVSVRDKKIKLWNRKQNETEWLPIPANCIPHHPRFTPDSTRLVFSFSRFNDQYTLTALPDLWHGTVFTLGQKKAPIVLPEYQFGSEFLDSKLLLGGANGQVRCWDITTGACYTAKPPLDCNWYSEYLIAFSADKFLFCNRGADADHPSRLISAVTFAEEQRFDMEFHAPLSPDKKWAVVSRGFSDQKYLFQFASGKFGIPLPRWPLKECQDACPQFSEEMLQWLSAQAALNPVLISARVQRGIELEGRSALVRDQWDGRVLCELHGHTAEIRSVAFSTDGQKLITSDSNRDIRIWSRRRLEYWWGVAWLPEFWLTVLLAVAFLWSLRRDRKEAR